MNNDEFIKEVMDYDFRIRNRNRIKMSIQKDYDNLPEEEKKRRKENINRLVKEMGMYKRKETPRDYEMATQGY